MENHALLIKCALTAHSKPDSFLLREGSDEMWETVLTTFMEIHPLHTKYAVKWKQEKNYIHCFLKESSGNTWKSIHYLLNVPWQHRENKIHYFSIEGSYNMWKPYLMFRWTTVTIFMGIYLLFSKCAVTTQGKLHPLLFKKEEWQHEKSNIRCLVKQQWQHMEIYPFLTNCVRQHMEN